MYRQAHFFRLNPDTLPDNTTLADKLAASAFTPPQGLDWFSEGFTAPTPFSDGLIFEAGDTVSFALKREEKVLPAGVIRDILDEKVAEIQENEGHTVGRKEKQELKEQITDDLLPRAFTQRSRIYGLIDRQSGLLIIDHASAAKAEKLLFKLREALGGLQAETLNTRESPSALMTRWLLNGQAEGRFNLDSDTRLRGSGDVAPTVQIRRQDLTAEEVIHHAKNGKTVTELGLVWHERTAFILTDDLTLKRIQYLDTLMQEIDCADDLPSLLFAKQLICARTLSSIAAELAECAGGWQNPF